MQKIRAVVFIGDDTVITAERFAVMSSSSCISLSIAQSSPS